MSVSEPGTLKTILFLGVSALHKNFIISPRPSFQLKHTIFSGEATVVSDVVEIKAGEVELSCGSDTFIVSLYWRGQVKCGFDKYVTAWKRLNLFLRFQGIKAKEVSVYHSYKRGGSLSRVWGAMYKKINIELFFGEEKDIGSQK